MTAERIEGRVVFNCDIKSCTTTRESDTDDFDVAWTDARWDGWRCFKICSGEWVHYCPECARRN